MKHSTLVNYGAGLLALLILTLNCGASHAGTITITDRNNRQVEVNAPARRVVSIMQECTTVMLTLGAGDRLVGVDSLSAEDLVYRKAWFDSHPAAPVGKTKAPNIELIVSLKPDLILTWGGYGTEPADELQRKTGVPVVCLHTLTTINGVKENYKLVARLIGEQERARKLLEFGDDIIEKISSVTDQIPEKERPKVHLLFWGFWNGVSRIPIYYDPVQIAGGINIARGQESNVYGYSIKVPVEQVVVWNPDFILIHGSPKKWTPVNVDKVLTDPRIAGVNAVRNKNVYYTLGMWRGWHYPRALTETLYMACRFHPKKFADIDPEAYGNKIYEFFFGKPGLWTARGRELGFIE